MQTYLVMHQTPKSQLPSSLVKKDRQPLRTVQPTQDLSHSAEVPVSHDGLQTELSKSRLPNQCPEYMQYKCGFRPFCPRFYLYIFALGPVGMQMYSKKIFLEGN